jgi:hypothetical protein
MMKKLVEMLTLVVLCLLVGACSAQAWRLI